MQKNPLSKLLLNTVLCYLALALTDMFIHQFLLADSYIAIQHLWRPQEETNIGLMQIVSVLSVFIFSYIYYYLIGPKKGVFVGLRFGITIGLLLGLAGGFITYSTQPITITIAWGWFLASIFQYSIVGFISGAVLKKPES